MGEIHPFSFPICPIEIYKFFGLFSVNADNQPSAFINDDWVTISTVDIEAVTGASSGGYSSFR